MSKEKPNGKTETQDPVRSSALMLGCLSEIINGIAKDLA